MMNLRRPDGEKVSGTDTQSILKAMTEPAVYWPSVKDIVITPNGDTFEDCVRAAALAYNGETPLAAHMEAAMYHAALQGR